MEALSPFDKLVIYTLNKHSSPIGYMRMVRLLHLSDLSHQLLHEEPIGFNWLRTNNKVAPWTSTTISQSINKLLRLKIVQRHGATRQVRDKNDKLITIDVGNSAYSLTGRMPVTIDAKISYSINTYLNSYFISCHPRFLDKEETKLINKLASNNKGGLFSIPK